MTTFGKGKEQEAAKGIVRLQESLLFRPQEKPRIQILRGLDNIQREQGTPTTWHSHGPHE